MTARCGKVAVLPGFQDFSRLKRDYGDKEAAVVMNTVSISTRLDNLIPAGRISNLTQGMFVGAIADNFDETS